MKGPNLGRSSIGGKQRSGKGRVGEEGRFWWLADYLKKKKMNTKDRMVKSERKHHRPQKVIFHIREVWAVVDETGSVREIVGTEQYTNLMLVFYCARERR